jgi:large subunit ribosomal protein L4
MQAQLLNTQGKEVGTVDLQEKVFGLKPSKSFLHEYVTVYLNNQRAYSANTKTRTEVSGGGRKPWKQKHTGRARAGSNRSPLWRHGGIAHGPKSGRVLLSIPRQKAKAALAQALAARYQDNGIVFVENLAIEQAKTKNVAALLKQLGCAGRTLLVLDQPDAKLSQASRNIPNVEILLAGDLNAYVVLRSKKLVVTRPALEKLGARWN